MSGAKRLLEEQEERWRVAIGIALAAKVVRVCEFHTHILIDNSDGDFTPAYRKGNARLSAGELGSIFKSPRDLTDTIKAAVEDQALDGCPHCDKD